LALAAGNIIMAMIVVFDSNVWLSELGLRFGAAAAAKFFLNRSGARLAVPEVVRLEVQHNLRARLGYAVKTEGRKKRT
jgi:hypothetical protein